MVNPVSKGESGLKVSLVCSVSEAPVQVTNTLQSSRNIWPLTATKSCLSEGQRFTSYICIASVFGWALSPATGFQVWL